MRPRSRHIMPPHHASLAQVIGAVGAMCAAGGATYYAINVAKVFGGNRGATRRAFATNGRGTEVDPTTHGTRRMRRDEDATETRPRTRTRGNDGGGLTDETLRSVVRAGEPLPSTMTKEWEDATRARAEAWPREGSETPVKLSPMTK